ncbi:sigma-70 family RNA polymerase sigma factor [Nocardioides sp.]|uniref:sigma-70 family RNA polymerase sigma factor n=1 Tax=Nocardioides sp. TaxID=35761 RepID=UPI0027350A58|nr:sigma-70 family RNA polymerase sigma factor [Nocardioides sp.]MDP3894210.1 sigma-70 family RNA polymerase sigma factor [Nocardioides sp.]
MATTTSTPFDNLPRERRQELTAELLLEASTTDDETIRTRELERVVLLNMCVARSIASRYRGRGIADEDLEQVAYTALVRAAQKFDAGQEKDFLSYAVPSIRGELRRHFRDHGWTVRPPRRVQELQTQVLAERAISDGSPNSVPSNAEIAERLEVPEEDVAEALRAEGCFTPTSLDRPLGEGSPEMLGDVLPDVTGDQDLEAAEARVALRPVVRKLRSRDRRILQLRFFEDRTQQEIADEIGVTQMQVSRLLSRILRDLREDLAPTADEGQRVRRAS